MTDAEIRQIALTYCVKTGTDPLEMEGFALRLERIMDHVRDHLAMREAIAEALGEKGVGNA